MKQPPYFKLTEVEPQTAIWAGLMFMLITATMIALAGQRLSNAARMTPAGAQINSPARRELLSALQQTFITERQRGEVGIADAKSHLQLSINAQLLFPAHETELSPGGRNLLNRLAQTLRSSTGAGYQQIQIEGHTARDDFASVHSPRDNWELSGGQAISALKYLAAATRLDDRLFSAHGYAAARPLPAARSEAHKLRNGRLEIFISFERAGLRP
jgi:flagellar motor protein MotB